MVSRSIVLEITLQPPLLSYIHVSLKTCFRITNQLIPILGFDWVLVFMQSHLHKTTIVIALDILLCLIRSSEFFTRFRDGVTCGGWLENSQELLEDRMLHGKITLRSVLFYSEVLYS